MPIYIPSPPQTMTPAAKLRPSPNVPGSMEAAVKMWLKVGNIQKLQRVRKETYLIKMQKSNALETLETSKSFKDKGSMQWSNGFALLPGKKKGWEEEEEKGVEGQCT